MLRALQLRGVRKGLVRNGSAVARLRKTEYHAYMLTRMQQTQPIGEEAKIKVDSGSPRALRVLGPKAPLTD
jgi:hypothetical protein